MAKFGAGISEDLYGQYVLNGIKAKSMSLRGRMAGTSANTELTPQQEFAVEVINSAYRELVFRMKAVNAKRCGEDQYGLYQLFPASVDNLFNGDLNSYVDRHAKKTDRNRWASYNEPWDEDWLMNSEDSPLTFFKSPPGVPRTFAFWFKFLYDGSTDIDGTLFIERALEEAEEWAKLHYTRTNRIL